MPISLLMYKPENLLIGAKHPNLACREVNRRYYNISHGSKFNEKGTKIIEEDWDILIILDACRKDMFYKLCNIEGDLDSRISRGSNTREFLYGNFKDENLYDTIYTTANPQFEKHRNELNTRFHQVNNIWNTKLWDKENGTVHPRDVTRSAKQQIEENPNKRHLIHYLQPHYPFIDTELKEIGSSVLDQKSEGSALWGLLMRGKIDISKEEINKSYYRNLEFALKAVEELINDVPGKIIITSDHGNMIGERSKPIPIKEWGHPSGIYTPELVEVPWLTLIKGERPEITTSDPRQLKEDANEKVIEDRLKDLGYM